MKKISLALIGLISQTVLWAQDTTSTTILASDPTQVYTHIDFNGGINFESYPNHFGPESWDFNLTGNIAIKNFLIGSRIPFTNNGSTYSLLGDMDVFASYRLFNRDGFFKASMLRGGVLFPTSYDGYGVSLGQVNNGFFNLYLSYTAALEVTPKLSIYPIVGVRQYQSVQQPLYVTFPTDTSFMISELPEFTQTALNVGLTLSYDFSPKSFLQLNVFYERGIWNITEGTGIYESRKEEFTRSVFRYSLKYQYSLTSRSFLYLQAAYYPKEKWFEPFNLDMGYNRYKIILGYQYFLGK